MEWTGLEVADFDVQTDNSTKLMKHQAAEKNNVAYWADIIVRNGTRVKRKKQSVILSSFSQNNPVIVKDRSG